MNSFGKWFLSINQPGDRQDFLMCKDTWNTAINSAIDAIDSVCEGGDADATAAIERCIYHVSKLLEE